MKTFSATPRDITQRWFIVDAEGMVHLPLDKPGIGVDVDLDRIEDLTVRREVLSPGASS